MKQIRYELEIWATLIIANIYFANKSPVGLLWLGFTIVLLLLNAVRIRQGIK